MSITPCIPGRKSRDKTIKYDKYRYKRRNRIEIMFGHLKDWRRVATSYDRCPKVFLSAIALAAAERRAVEFHCDRAKVCLQVSFLSRFSRHLENHKHSEPDIQKQPKCHQ